MKTTYLVTGRTVFGRRFHIASENKAYLMGINIYRGSFWIVRGKYRKLSHRVWN